MVALWSSLYLLISAFYITINAQQEESIYRFGFEDPSDWSLDEGSFNSSRHTFTPIVWYANWNGDYSNCPRYNDGGIARGDASCVRLFMDASISRIISTEGYHSIHLQIDVNPSSVESPQDEWCYIQYRTATTHWINHNIAQGHDIHILNFDIAIPDNNTYNNEASFEVTIGIDATTGGDSCLFDNLVIFGVPYRTPIANTTHIYTSDTMATSSDGRQSNGSKEAAIGIAIALIVVIVAVLSIAAAHRIYEQTKIGRTFKNLVLDLQDVVDEPGSGLNNNAESHQPIQMEDKTNEEESVSVEEVQPETKVTSTEHHTMTLLDRNTLRETAEGEQVTENEGSERKPLNSSTLPPQIAPRAYL